MAKDKTNDMTVGNPVSLIIRFMIPMSVSYTHLVWLDGVQIMDEGRITDPYLKELAAFRE